MLRGLYTAASGMLLEGLKTDAIANNLANVDTHGYKRQTLTSRSFPEMLISRIGDRAHPFAPPGVTPIGWLGTGAALDQLPLDIRPGALRFTGNPLDIAVTGPGFIAVQLGEGEVAYSRHGALGLDDEGYLVNHLGHRVLGEEGPIRIAGHQVTIADDGVVWADGQAMGRIALFEFPLPGALHRLGDGLLQPTAESGEAAPAENSAVRSEYLERSNVDVITEMVALITTQRAYEANQRVIQLQDEALGRLINDAS